MLAILVLLTRNQERLLRHLDTHQLVAVEVAATTFHRPAVMAAQEAAPVAQVLPILVMVIHHQPVLVKVMRAARVALVAAAIRALVGVVAQALWVQIVVVVLLAQAVQAQPG